MSCDYHGTRPALLVPEERGIITLAASRMKFLGCVKGQDEWCKIMAG